MIYTQLDECEMIDDLMLDDNGGWSYPQAESLAAYYIQLSKQMEGSMRWDAVSINSDWRAYDSEEEAINDFDSVEEFESNTAIITCSDATILLQEF